MKVREITNKKEGGAQSCQPFGVEAANAVKMETIKEN